MVTFAQCGFCHRNIYGIQNNWLPWCLTCVIPIERTIYCYHCIEQVYDASNHCVKENYENILTINCETCGSQEIGFDNRRQAN